jgi:hypothetical protein
MTGHDEIYHLLFGDPRLVAQLLREFAPGPWLEQHDLDDLSRLNAKFHADTGQRREGDVIWELPRRGGGKSYLLLLLEFQSNSDRWMALRILVYVGLLWQHLIKENQLLPGARLPPVLPIVLYRGQSEWAVPLALRDLIGLDELSTLWPFQPDAQYYLIEQRIVRAAEPGRREGLVALLFRLENAADPTQLFAVAGLLKDEFVRSPDFTKFRSLFGQLLTAAVQTLAPGIDVTEDFWEGTDVLQARMENWLQSQIKEHRQEGRREGEAVLLQRLLERRFGPLPAWARERIATADTQALEIWGLRVLDVASLDEVLA